MVALATHAYATEQHERAAELWRRILGTHVTTSHEERRGYQSYLETVTDDHLSTLIRTNGQETDDYYPVMITLASYSEYGGSDLDAANVRYLRETETPGVHFGSGAHGTEYAWVQLGELPTNGDDIDTGIDWLQYLADLMDAVAEYGLISDESHSEYVDELAEEAWDQWLGTLFPRQCGSYPTAIRMTSTSPTRKSESCTTDTRTTGGRARRPRASATKTTTAP